MISISIQVRFDWESQTQGIQNLEFQGDESPNLSQSLTLEKSLLSFHKNKLHLNLSDLQFENQQNLISSHLLTIITVLLSKKNKKSFRKSIKLLTITSKNDKRRKLLKVWITESSFTKLKQSLTDTENPIRTLNELIQVFKPLLMSKCEAHQRFYSDVQAQRILRKEVSNELK